MLRNGDTMTGRFTPERATPDELADLSESDFKAVVDADLRRRVRPEGLPAEVAAALRSPQHVERWCAALERICQSVEGQIVAAADDYDAQLTAAEVEIARLRRQDAGEDRVQSVIDSTNTLRTEYHSKKAARERFLTGVNEHLVMATSLRDQQRATSTGALATDERTHLLDRIDQLERTIDAHRTAVMADCGDGEEPHPYEEALWAVLEVSDG